MKYDKKRKRRKENNKTCLTSERTPRNLIWKESIFLSAYRYLFPCRIRRMSLVSDAITRLDPLVYHEIVTRQYLAMLSLILGTFSNLSFWQIRSQRLIRLQYFFSFFSCAIFIRQLYSLHSKFAPF